MLRSIFKLYDIRGTYPSQINEAVVIIVMRVLSVLFGKNIRVIIGHDARYSSPALYAAAVQALYESGCQVVTVGMITTPMSMFAVHQLHSKKDIGVMITASHNPKNQNGIKIIDTSMQVLGGLHLYTHMQKIKKIPLAMTTRTPLPIQNKEQALKKRYANFLSYFFSKKRPQKKIRIIVDCSHGSAGPIFKNIQTPPWIHILFLHTKPDGNFPAHGPNPLLKSSHAHIKKEIRKQKADFGVIVDGDGDRVVFFDDKARYIRPEYIWRLLVGHKKWRRSVYTELNSFVIKKMLNDVALRDMALYQSPVGRVSLIEAMRKRNADIGFENSGHFYFKDFFGSDSGILACIQVMEAVLHLPYRLSDFIDMLPGSIRLPELNIPCGSSGRVSYKKIAKYVRVHKKQISFFDGMSVCAEDLFLNVRASHTEPHIRINAEGMDYKKVKKSLIQLAEIVRRLVREK